MSSHVVLVARRELTEAFRARSYWVTMGFLVVGVLVAIVLPRVLDGSTSYDLGIVDPGSEELRGDLSALAGRLDVELELHAFDDADAATAAVQDGDVDAALVVQDGASSLHRMDNTSEELVALTTQAWIASATRASLLDSGLDEAEAAAALTVPPPEAVVLDEERSGRGAVTYFVSLVLYLALLMGGMGVASGVAVEKSSRIAEVLVTTVRPSMLLAGKVLGVGISTLLLILAAAVPYSAAVAFGVVDLPHAVAIEVMAAVGWFVLGYALYATAYAAMGALVDRQEDLGAAVGPLTTALILSFLAAMQAQSDPESTIAQVTSLIPLSAPMVMPVRIAEEAVGPLEVLAAVVLCVVTFLLLVRIGGTIYRKALLRGGQRLKVTDVLRS